MVRAFPEQKYVGFDVMMWDALDKVDQLKEALVLAVGGNPNTATTSFRVVSGGMPGRGEEVCQKQELSSIAENAGVCTANKGGGAFAKEKGPANLSMVESMVSAVMSRFKDEPVFIAVICGEKDSECTSLEAVKNLLRDNDEGTIAPIYSCYSTARLSACQDEMLDGLLAAVDAETKINGIIIDASATQQTSQNLHAILAKSMNFDALMEEDHKGAISW